MPLTYDRDYVFEGQTLSRYRGTCHLIKAGKDYSDEPQPFDFAVVEMFTDSNRNVEELELAVYRFDFDGPDDPTGTAVFDRYTELEAGDQLRFTVKAVELASGRVLRDTPLETDFVVLENQDPEIRFRQVARASEEELVYTVRATDFSDNETYAPIQRL